MKGLKKLLSIGVVVAMLLVLAPVLVPSVALASDNVSANVTTTAGAETFAIGSGTTFSFADTALTGSQITNITDVYVDAWWILTDASGDGAGWNIQIKANSAYFDNQSSHPGCADNLTLGSTLADQTCVLEVVIDPSDADLTIKLNDGTSSPVSEIEGTGGVANAGTATDIDTNYATIVEAPTDVGLGKYDVRPKFSLQLPAGTYTGVYQLTLTVTTTFS